MTLTAGAASSAPGEIWRGSGAGVASSATPLDAGRRHEAAARRPPASIARKRFCLSAERIELVTTPLPTPTANLEAPAG
jgi:hypothetical protein